MKYSVDIKNEIAKETLVFNGKEYTRTTKKTNFGSCSTDMDFCEQMENDGLTDDVLDIVDDALDGFLADKLLDIAESENE
jgi:hypothetical protein